jgi:hypothetical protein
MKWGAAVGAGTAGRRPPGWTYPLLAGVLSLGLAAWAMKLWRADLSVPLRYVEVDDAKFYLGLAKGIIDHGWYASNASLGAPFGQHLYDFPQGADVLNLAIMRVLALFSSNPAVVVNVFYLLTYPLIAASAWLALRAAGVSRGAATVCAVIFALLPYHFNRGESHLLLSAYYEVPLGAYLFLSLLGGRPLFTRRADGRRGPARLWGAATGRTLQTLLACVVIATAGLYYAAFAIVLILGATLALAVARRGRQAVLAGVAVIAVIAVTLAADLGPSIVYQARHGHNAAVARAGFESEQLGLKLTNLVLPVRDHRFGPLSHVNQDYSDSFAPGYCESCYATLGTVGTVGFLWLCLSGLAMFVAGRGWLAARDGYRHAALGAGLAFVVGTVGGISSLIALGITPDIRGWNRISVFIAFFSLLAAGWLLDGLLRRIGARVGAAPRARPRGALLGFAALVAVMVLGVWDETTPYFIPGYRAAAAEYSSDAVFGRAMDRALPPGSEVFALPYVPYPEGYAPRSRGVSPPNPTLGSSYELMRGYLHTSHLRWSYGAIKGRNGDWQSQLAPKPLGLSISAAAAAGFAGLYVDPRGYDDQPRGPFARALAGLLGVAPLVSPRHDLWFFDLRPFARRLAGAHSARQLGALRDATLTPLRAQCGSGGLVLENPSSGPVAAVLSAVVTSAAGGPGALGAAGATIRVVYPDNSQQQLELGRVPITITRRIQLGPGRSSVRMAAVGAVGGAGGGAAGGVFVSAPNLTAGAFEPFAVAGAAAGPSLARATGITAPPCSIGPSVAG